MILSTKYWLNLEIKPMYKISVLFGVLLLALACGNSIPSIKIEFISKTKIVVPEPSGLTFYNGSLFVISDANSFLYQMSLSGKLEHKYAVPVKGMEGVAFDEKKKAFVLLSETKRKMTYYSLKDGVGASYKIKGKQSADNDGLEGVCFNSKKESLYVLNEAKPKKLLKISSKGKIKKNYDLSFGKDVSGIVYDDVLDVFWILSDASKALYKVDDKGELLQEFPLSIEKAEGIAIDDQRRLYIVSDQTADLFIFQIK